MTHDQLTPGDLKGLTPEEIVDAYESGRLDAALGRSDVDLIARATTGDITPADVTSLRHLGREDLIVAAHQAGRINLEGDTQ